MTNRQTGGLKAKEKNLARNPNHYSEIGRKGGLAKVKKGFAMNRQLASEAGARGGKSSRTKPTKKSWWHR